MHIWITRSADIESLVKSLETAQDQVFTNLQTALKIEVSDFPDSLGLAVWEKKAHKGEVFGYKGNTRLVWTGRIKASSYDGKNYFTETAIWVGPLTQVSSAFFLMCHCVGALSVPRPSPRPSPPLSPPPLTPP